jgi:hypothetical protein
LRTPGAECSRTHPVSTYYQGKWHISHADIEIPGTHESLMLDEQRAKKCLTPVTNEGVTRAGGEGRVVIEVPEGVRDAALAAG